MVLGPAAVVIITWEGLPVDSGESVRAPHPSNNDHWVTGRCHLMGSAKFEKPMGTHRPGEAMDVCTAQRERYDDARDLHVDPGEIDG